ncbi:M15 family metallopeptidase [Demequina sp. NBRC 110053]|uniref:M15 family metallopeptidase n=1 Tax=Demequina sp. NBRC 110053 TaxID=1570342 RepID=UPI000A0446F3|nr:M15 family metallopeptidase [Demequina sp. NBRC 110053]
MHSPLSRPYVQLAASVSLACFSIGLFSAHSAHALDRHRALTEARAAAAELEEDRTRFAQSIEKAEDAVAAAKGLADEPEISDAADALVQSIAHARSLAVPQAAEGAPDTTEIVVDGVAPVADDMAAADGAEPARSPDEPGTAEDAEQPISPAADATPHPTPAPAEGPILDEAEDAVADVEQVLDGDLESTEDALAATRRLTAASEALDRAAADVDAETRSLQEATAAIALAQNLLVLDGSLARASELVEHTTAIIADVGQRVVTIATLADARATNSGMRAAVAEADDLDRDDGVAVEEQLDALAAATSELDHAMGQLQVSHESWLAEENSRRDTINATRLTAYEASLEAAREDHKAVVRDVAESRSAGWSGQPAGVSGSNGRLARDSLCDVDFADGHRLQCDAAAALEAADAAYHAESGRHLVMTDSYRTYASQVVTKARKPSTAARPGTSNHGWGMAVDLDHPSATWLAANGADYGWIHPTWARAGGSRPEWWHLEFVAADVAFDAPDEPALVKPAASAFGDATFGDTGDGGTDDPKPGATSES